MNRPHPEHLSDDALIRKLYGLESAAGEPHLETCLECIRRWEAMRRTREVVTVEPEVPAAVLREQRLRIFDRLERGSANGWRRVWVPAAAAVLLIVAGVAYFRPAEEITVAAPASVPTEFVDAGWYDEAYSDMQPLEPRAATPIRELFEEEASE